MLELMSESLFFFTAVVFVLSLLIGSFLNVVIYRLPMMMKREWQNQIDEHEGRPLSHCDKFNLMTPSSTCPSCEHKIAPWENIPVISWLCLRGQCSNCQSAISIRYPIVEVSTAVLSALGAYVLGFTPFSVFFIVGIWMLIAMTCIDFDEMLLPDSLTLTLLWMGLLVHAIFYPQALADMVYGAALGYLSLFSVYWLFKLVTGKEGMGFGDFKLLAALGAWVGWQHLPIVILLSSVVGAIVGLTLMKRQQKDAQLAIPFGPYLAVAGYLTVLFGEKISNWYIQTLVL